MIPASLLLVLGLGLILFGLQIFFIPDRRKVPSEMIKATILVVGGLYLVFFLSQQLSKGNTSSAGYPPPGY